MTTLIAADSAGSPDSRAARRAFLAGLALAFAASAGATVAWHAFPSALDAMPLCGGGAIPAWARLPGQAWPGAALSFLAMWTAMMMAMMLPAVAPALWAYRQAAAAAGQAHAGWRAALAGLAYFGVWAAAGTPVYPLGALWLAAQDRFPALAAAAPAVAGAAVLAAGAIQLSRWKARHLACCRRAGDHPHTLPGSAATACRYGLRLGRHCLCSCAGPTLLLLATGVMNLGVMAAATALIALERLAPSGERSARLGGLGMLGLGVVLLARAAWPA